MLKFHAVLLYILYQLLVRHALRLSVDRLLRDTLDAVASAPVRDALSTLTCCFV